MTSVADRIAELFQIKVNDLLDRAEDPREVLDFAHTQQMDLLQQVRRALVDVATGRRRLEDRAAALREAQRQLEDQARQAAASGREDLARQALEQRARTRDRLADLEEQGPLLEAEERRLEAVLRRLDARVRSFGERKEVLKAAYTRAEAEARVAEAVAGIGPELGDVGAAVRRAADRTEQLHARAAAAEALTAPGFPAGAGMTDADDVRFELERIAADRDVEEELKRLRAKPTAPPGTDDEPGEGRGRAESGGESSV